MRINNKGNIKAQEDDKEKDSNQKNNNRSLTDCVESISDQHVYLNNKVGAYTSPGISHRTWEVIIR